MSKEEFLKELERNFKAKMRSDTEKMMRTFSFEENMNIAYVPLVLTTLAFEYTHRVLEQCAVRKIGRAHV